MTWNLNSFSSFEQYSFPESVKEEFEKATCIFYHGIFSSITNSTHFRTPPMLAHNPHTHAETPPTPTTQARHLR